MSKIKYIVIEKNKPSKQAIEDLNNFAYSIAKTLLNEADAEPGKNKAS